METKKFTQDGGSEEDKKDGEETEGSIGGLFWDRKELVSDL